MDFQLVKDALISAGRVFGPETLQLLDYKDLVRAGVGDAGDAACSLDIIKDERTRRLRNEMRRIVEHEGQEIPIPDADLYVAAFAHLHSRPHKTLVWEELSYVTQGYLLLRCLRAHTDTPGSRLEQLQDVMASLRVDPHQSYPLRGVAIVLSHVLHRFQEAKGLIDIVAFRKATGGSLLQTFATNLPADERVVRKHLEVANYHCTHGCYSPRTLR